jgi:hypothetical protein
MVTGLVPVKATTSAPFLLYPVIDRSVMILSTSGLALGAAPGVRPAMIEPV